MYFLHFLQLLIKVVSLRCCSVKRGCGLKVMSFHILLPNLIQLLLQVMTLFPVDLELVLQQLTFLINLLYLCVLLGYSSSEVVNFVGFLIVL